MQQEALRYLMSNATSAWQNQIGWVRISVFIALLTEGHNSPAKGKNVSRNTPSQKNIHTDPTNKIPSDVTPCAYSEKELKHFPNVKVLQSTCETYSPQSCCHDNPTTLTDKEPAITTPNAETLLTEGVNEPTATTDIKMFEHTWSTPNAPSLAQTLNHLQ